VKEGYTSEKSFSVLEELFPMFILIYNNGEELVVMALVRLDQISNSKIYRLSTGFPYLDRAFGVTNINGTDVYGMPRGRIVFASGSPGVGKTRFAISVVKRINALGGKILVFQGEVRPQEFKQWTGSNVADETNFFVSDDREIVKIIGYIKQEKPEFVVIDSANMIEDYNKSSEIRIILDSLKKTVAEVGCVCFMTGHLTKDGKMKGNADVAHLVDVECSIVRLKLSTVDGMSFIEPMRAVSNRATFKRAVSRLLSHNPGMFRFNVGKNRYGPSGGWSVFNHIDSGIEFVDSPFGYNDEFVNDMFNKMNSSSDPGEIKVHGSGVFDRFRSWLSK